MLIHTSSLRLLTSNTVAKFRLGPPIPRSPGGACPSVNAPSPGIPPVTAPVYGDIKGDARLCINGLLSTPGAPETKDFSQNFGWFWDYFGVYLQGDLSLDEVERRVIIYQHLGQNRVHRFVRYHRLSAMLGL